MFLHVKPEHIRKKHWVFVLKFFSQASVSSLFQVSKTQFFEENSSRKVLSRTIKKNHKIRLSLLFFIYRGLE
ncbi:MAG: hypothetical protein CME68_05875 [Halobacteriovoraceae bacterium]|nr:hypothetical protein [Halobacteriovoraceae bacterium]